MSSDGALGHRVGERRLRQLRRPDDAAAPALPLHREHLVGRGGSRRIASGMTAPRPPRAARRRRWSLRPADTARSAHRRRTPAPPGTRAPRPSRGGMRPRTTRHRGPRQTLGWSRPPTARGRAAHRARLRAGRAPLLPLRPRTPPPANRVRAAPSPRRSHPRSPPPPARPPRWAAGPPRPPLVRGGIRRRAPRTQAWWPPPAHRWRRRGRTRSRRAGARPCARGDRPPARPATTRGSRLTPGRGRSPRAGSADGRAGRLRRRGSTPAGPSRRRQPLPGCCHTVRR